MAARGRKVRVDCGCGQNFKIVEILEDEKVRLSCSCGKTKDVLREKIDGEIEDVSGDVDKVIDTNKVTEEIETIQEDNAPMLTSEEMVEVTV